MRDYRQIIGAVLTSNMHKHIGHELEMEMTNHFADSNRFVQFQHSPYHLKFFKTSFYQ